MSEIIFNSWQFDSVYTDRNPRILNKASGKTKTYHLSGKILNCLSLANEIVQAVLAQTGCYNQKNNWRC